MKKTGKLASHYPVTNPIQQSTHGDTEVTRIFHDQSDMGVLTNLSSGAQLDFRVEAYTGYWHDPLPAIGFRESWVVCEESSGWSNIQTITIPYESPSSSLPTQTTSLPENPTTSNSNQTTLTNFTLPTNFLLAIITFLLCVIVVLVILFLRRQPKTRYQEKGLYV